MKRDMVLLTLAASLAWSRPCGAQRSPAADGVSAAALPSDSRAFATPALAGGLSLLAPPGTAADSAVHGRHIVRHLVIAGAAVLTVGIGNSRLSHNDQDGVGWLLVAGGAVAFVVNLVMLASDVAAFNPQRGGAAPRAGPSIRVGVLREGVPPGHRRLGAGLHVAF